MNSQSENSLSGKTIIVTGGGGGIGRATCSVLSAAGAQLVISDKIEAEGQTTLELVKMKGGSAVFIQADLESEEEIRELVNSAIAKYGRIDGAFNNAGIAQCGLPLADISTELWQSMLGTNLSSVFLCLKYEIRAMVESGGGAIVNTASSLSQVAIPNAAEYVAAKHGVLGLTRAAAADYGARGIRVNAVLPGIIRTPMFERHETDPRAVEFIRRLRDRHPMGRFGESPEIGEACRWLLSDQASFVNGASLAVDGGYLAT